MPSTRENKAIQRKEPGYRLSPIRFEPKGVHIQIKYKLYKDKARNTEP